MIPANSISPGRRLGHCLGLALVLGLAGCSGGPALEYAEVEGKVTLAGKPLAGVIVTFYPVAQGMEALPFAIGTTNPTGTYTLVTRDGKPGAVVGKTRVVVNWPPRERNDGLKARPAPSGPPIPLRNTIAAETPLLFEVKAGGRQTIDLPLAQ